MAEETPDSIQRWTAKRRVALVVTILKGETSVAEAARKHGLTVSEVEVRWEIMVTICSKPGSPQQLKDSGQKGAFAAHL